MRRSRVLRIWTYFRRGHNTYLAFLLSFANFIVIQYQLLIRYIPVLKLIFINILGFTLMFFIIYIPLGIFIGWKDYRKYAVPVDTELMARANPWTSDLAESLMLIAENKNEEAVEVLKKWVK